MVMCCHALITRFTVLCAERLLKVANGTVFVFHKQNYFLVSSISLRVKILSHHIFLKSIHLLIAYTFILFALCLTIKCVWLNHFSEGVRITCLIIIIDCHLSIGNSIPLSIFTILTIDLQLGHLIRCFCHHF